MHMILFPNAWMAEMHLSSVCVNYCRIFLETNSYIFPNSMSNSLIKTSAFKTFPKSSSFKRSSGNFGTSLSSPFPKPRNLKRRSLKTFVLRLFDKFVPFYPTLTGCRRFLSTHKVGPWTPLTSNPFNVLLAVLMIVENGDWLTAVARWHTRYLLRRISERPHDRAPEVCARIHFLREPHCFGCVACSGSLCVPRG